MKGLIFTWILTAFGVGGSVISPFYGFLAYVALAILKPDALWSHAIQNGRYSLVVALAMLISWGARGGGNWDLGKARPVVLMFTGFWMWCVMLAMMAEHPELAWNYVEQMGKILLPFLVGITSCKTEKDLKALAWVIVVCSGYVCFEMNLWYFRGYNYLYFIGFAGHDNNSAAIGFVAALGVSFFLFLNTDSVVKKGIIGLFMGCILHAILFSFSRGAMLATVLGVGISFFIIKKNSMHYTLFAIGIVAALFLAGPEVRARFSKTFTVKNGQREASAQSRLDLWKDCFVVFMRDPVFGCGPDHWPTHAEEFGWEKGKEAHSLWVQTATETGFPGILMYGGFFAYSVLICLRFLIRLPPRAPPWFGDSCRMTIASLCGFAVAAQFVTLELLEIPYYVVLLGTGSIIVYSRQVAAGELIIDAPPAEADWRNAVADDGMYGTPQMGEAMGILN